MIRSLVVRDIRARYMGSYLGVFWAIVHPLTQLLIFWFVFSVVLKTRLGAEYTGMNYAVWLMSGMLPWIFFSEVVNRSPGAVVEQTSLITKTVFPSEILPFTHMTAALVNHGIIFTILLVFSLLLGYGVSMNILWLPVYLLGIMLFALGLAWILSALNVFLRDIGQILGVVLNLWFFFTPIFYPANMIPAGVRPWAAANPMLHAVEGYRMGMLGRTQPDLNGMFILYGYGLVALMFGGLLFKRLKPAFADVL